ncbi:MAG: exodeoxyribonuclease III [Alphaproteobacteria bacterium]|nr:exodeoxyribonuclease III [Alphaproteobacteria bacterium]
MRLTTWNVNSVRIRVELLPALIKATGADVFCLQETKVVDEDFPREPFARLGYQHQVIAGQKNHHGVAILSRLPFVKQDARGWCGKDDKRHASATLESGLEIHNFYVPAGGDIPDPEANEKFAHKLAFLRETAEWFGALKARKASIALVGDLNVAPLETDVWSHKQLLDVVSHTPIEVELLRKWMASYKFIDAVRHFVPPDERLYSWWSYRAADWEKSDRGRRLDHVWVSPALKDRLRAAYIFKPARDWKPPSDHVPVTVEINA